MEEDMYVEQGDSFVYCVSAQPWWIGNIPYEENEAQRPSNLFRVNQLLCGWAGIQILEETFH